jgi:prevent-host-death family protein
MPTISITEARSNLYKLAEEVNENSSPILLTNKNGKNCYLIGEEDFNALLETMYINSVEGLADLIIERGKAPREDFVDVDDLDL